MNKASQFCLALAIMASVLLPQLSFSQFSETIVSGRPGQSIPANTTGKGILQFQQGYVFSNTNTYTPILLSGITTVERETIAKNSTFENVIRFGITERIEINAAVDYVWSDTRSTPSMFFNEGTDNYLTNMDIGGRINLVEDEDGWPAIGVQARLGMGMNSSDSDFEIDDLKIIAAVTKQVGERHGITVNLVPTFSLNGFYNSYGYTLAYSFSFAERWSVFVENYGALYSSDQSNESWFTTYFDGGVAFLLNDNVQFDVLWGYGKNEGLNNEEESYFVSAGISWRLNTTK